MSLSLCDFSLIDHNVTEMPSPFGRNVATLSIVFNNLTNVGLAGVKRQTPGVVSLDLEDNDMVFLLRNKVVILL